MARRRNFLIRGKMRGMNLLCSLMNLLMRMDSRRQEALHKQFEIWAKVRTKVEISVQHVEDAMNISREIVEMLFELNICDLKIVKIRSCIAGGLTSIISSSHQRL